jgi:hypothetical protein
VPTEIFKVNSQKNSHVDSGSWTHVHAKYESISYQLNQLSLTFTLRYGQIQYTAYNRIQKRQVLDCIGSFSTLEKKL